MTDDELEAARKRNALPTVQEPTDAELDRDNLLRHVDELRAERDELRAKMEVAEAGYFAAVRQARWQAATNKELNDKQKELDALRAELAEAQDAAFRHANRCDEVEAELAALREAFKAANSMAEEFERKWYLRGDDLDALREAAGKVTCKACNGTGVKRLGDYPPPSATEGPCPDCADLRKILGEKP